MSASNNNTSPSSRPGQMPARAMAVKIAVCYALLGALWILVSGWLLHRLVQDTSLAAVLETFKGWFFVLVTAVLLGLALDRYFRELRKSAQRLQENEERLRLVSDNLPDSYVYQYLHEADGRPRFTYVSAGVERVHGLCAADVLRDANTLHAQIEPAHRKSLMTAEAESARTLTDFEIELAMRRTGGDVRMIHLRSRPRRNGEGQIQWDGVAVDVTERRQTEAGLRQRLELQDQVAKIAATVPGMIYSFRLRADGSACMPFCTPVIEELWGFRPEDLMEDFSPAFARVHPEDLPHLRKSVLESARTFSTWQHSFRVQHPRKGERWLEGHSVPRAEPDGSVLWHGFVQDVTDRKRAEAALERSESGYRLLAENVEDFVTVLDAQENRLYVSPSFYRVTGWTPAEVLQSPWDARLHPDDIPAIQESRTANLAGQMTKMEHRIRCRDGAWMWVESRCKPIPGPDGQVQQLLIWQHDITERKRLEAQLRQSQKLEAIGQLAGGVAHDFNNILAAIMMHLGLLQMNPSLDEETRSSLKDLDEQARRAAALTRQLLMFSRRSVLSVKPLDLNEVVANLLKMLTRLIGEHIELRSEGRAGLPLVEADAGMLEQALMNLVVNARDAMPKGGRITISTTQVEFSPADAAANPERQPGRFVCLAVSDTGCGMDAAMLKRIFEPFFTTKEAGKGTGLGLATVHGIVAQHRGWVEVDSAVGQGTTFRVYLPALARRKATASPSPAGEALRHGQETILLVEDDARVRETVGRSLRQLGYAVLEASNGQEAMTLWQAHSAQVDLLLTDMVMPEGMTGLELTERLQGLKPGLKAIISSGYSAEIVQAGVPDKAGVMYLPKPYPTKQLAEAVRDSLDQKPTGGT